MQALAKFIFWIDKKQTGKVYYFQEGERLVKFSL